MRRARVVGRVAQEVDVRDGVPLERPGVENTGAAERTGCAVSKPKPSSAFRAARAQRAYGYTYSTVLHTSIIISLL